MALPMKGMSWTTDDTETAEQRIWLLLFTLLLSCDRCAGPNLFRLFASFVCRLDVLAEVATSASASFLINLLPLLLFIHGCRQRFSVDSSAEV